MIANLPHRGHSGRRAFVAGAACSLTALGARSSAQRTFINEQMRGDVAPVHDPGIIKHGDSFYLVYYAYDAQYEGTSI